MPGPREFPSSQAVDQDGDADASETERRGRIHNDTGSVGDGSDDNDVDHDVGHDDDDKGGAEVAEPPTLTCCTFFYFTHTLCTFAHSSACYTHAWLKGGCLQCACRFSLDSPSPFSCFTRPFSCLSCCSSTVTSRPLPTTT